MSDFLTSVRDDLKSYFGRRWIWALVGLVILIFWPLIVFGKSLDIDPAAFTAEWIKMGTNGLILFLLIEVLSHKREKGILSKSADTFIMFYYIGPLAALKLELIEVYSRLNTSVSSEQTAPKLLNLWNNFEANLRLVDSAPGVGSAANILAQVNRINIVRAKKILSELQGLRSSSGLNKGEYEEVLRDIDTVLSGLVELRKRWQLTNEVSQ